MSIEEDPFGALAAARKPIAGDLGTEHKMVKLGDELTGTVTEASTVTTKFGERHLIKVDPVVAISDCENVTALGETKLWCSGVKLSGWFEREEPQPGDLVSIVLAELVDVDMPQPMKQYEIALRRKSDRDDETLFRAAS